jgi:hypothetical protein
MCFCYKHLLKQMSLQLQINGKQYSIKDPVMQSFTGTVPVKLFEYKDKPESAIKTAIEVSHPQKRKENPGNRPL